MDWPEFLKKLNPHPSITLVGPLLKGPYKAQQPTIYVDGGVRFLDPQADFDQISVGDGDSAPLQLDHKLPARKDYTDLAFALRELPPTVQRLELIGFWGGRRDHELAVFGELHRFLKKGRHRQLQLQTADPANPVLGFSQGSWSFQAHGVFSLIVFEPTEIQLTGACEYPLTTPTLVQPISDLGISNQGRGTVDLTASGPVFLFRA